MQKELTAKIQVAAVSAKKCEKQTSVLTLPERILAVSTSFRPNSCMC